MFKLLLPYEVPASVLDKYKDTFEFVGAVDGKEEISMDEAKELIRDCDAIFSMRVFPIPEELLACGEKLRVVTNHGVGYDHIDVAACSRRGILAINTPQAVCEPTAEFTMALLLGITKGITMFDRNLRRDRVCNIGVFFDRDILLYGKTVGIVGFGRIGQAVARRLQALTGADLFQLEPMQPYSDDYNECIQQAQDDQRRDARPALKACPETLDPYDTIYLGYPNYWGTMPMCVFTFLERFDFTGKTILPFCTHEGSGLGHSEADIRRLCHGAKVGKGLAIHGTAVCREERALEAWIKGGN